MMKWLSVFSFLLLLSFLLSPTSTGGGHKLLTSQPNVIANQSGNKIPWQASLISCDNDDGDQPVNKVTANQETFNQLFFKHRQKTLDTFDWIFTFDTQMNLRQPKVVISYFCQDQQTIPFPDNWRVNEQIRKKTFQVRWDAIKDTDWQVFLEEFAKSQVWLKCSPDFYSCNPGFYFLNAILYPAYLYFLNISKMDPYSDVSFLTFLENIKLYVTAQSAKKLITLQEARWLGVVPGISLQKLGPGEIDLTLLLDLNPNTLNLDDLSPAQKRLLVSRYIRYDINITPRNEWESWPRDGRSKIEQIFKIIIKEDFGIYFDTILNDAKTMGIKFFLFNDQEYSLENLISQPLWDADSNWDDYDGEKYFLRLNAASRI